MSADDSMWAPPGEGDLPPPRSPLGPEPALPDAPSQWAPPRSEPAAFAPTESVAVPEEKADEEVAAPTPVESLVVGPVEATTVAGTSRVGRLVATVAAVAMIGGGAVIAFDAGSAEGGADSPEDAFEQALAAVEAGDLVGLAEVIEPGERNTLFEAGFAFLDEMVRLDVLASEFDASAVDGYDLSLAGAELTVERPRDDLARIYVGSGVLDSGFDVAAMPLGSRLLDVLDADQRVAVDRRLGSFDGADSPFVAVRRDGRWYLSVWYTIAENARIDAGMPLPDLLDRPAPIGADTPEDAATRFFEEAARLDIVRMIGMLDPEEAAALYDYSPLFLEGVSAAANAALEAAEADGWSWEFEALDFRSETDGDLATVFLERMTFTATGADGSASVSLADGELAGQLTTTDDFWGEQTTWTLSTTGGCLEITVAGGGQSEQLNSCDDPGVVAGSAALQLHDVGLVARRVDGRWFLSPMRTALDGLIAAVEQLDSAEIAEALSKAFFVPSMVLDDAPATQLVGPSPTPSVPPAIAHADLLAPELDAAFAYDLDAERAAFELGFFTPGLEAVEVERGAYATIGVGGGEVALIVVEITDAEQAIGVIESFRAERPDVAALDHDLGLRLSALDDFGDPVYVHFDGSRLVVVGVYGASDEDAWRVIETQTAG